MQFLLITIIIIEIDVDFGLEFDDSNSKPSEGLYHDRREEIVKYWENAGHAQKLSFKSVQMKYRKLEHISMLYKWKNDLLQGGNKRQKMQEINRYVRNMFNLARSSLNSVHDEDLKRWALEKNQVTDKPYSRLLVLFCEILSVILLLPALFCEFLIVFF